MAQRFDLDPAAMLTFAAIARASGVRGAASVQGVPRSTVSRRLAELEAQVGAPLVIRTARRFVLTPLGIALAEHCEELEALLRRSDELVRRATEEPSGRLRVSAAPVIGEALLPGIVAELTRRYPRLSVDVRMSVEPADLRHGGVDVALRAGEIDDAGDLFATRLGAATAGCWVSPSYAAEHGVPSVPSDLKSHECILVGSRVPTTWMFRTAGREERVVVHGRVRVDSSLMARELAMCGRGVVRAACYLTEAQEASGDLVAVLRAHWVETAFHAVHAGANPPSPKVRAFIDLAKAAAAKLFGGPPTVSSPRPPR